MAVQSSQVASIGNAFRLSVLGDGHADHGGTQHMTRVGEQYLYLLVETIRGVIVHGAEQLHHLLCIAHVEEGFDLGFVLSVHLLVVPAHVLLLDEGGVLQHQLAQVACSGGAVYLAAKAEMVDLGYQS
mgnify:CR=1 FL=1